MKRGRKPKTVPAAETIKALLAGGWRWKQIEDQFGVDRMTIIRRHGNQALGILSTSRAGRDHGGQFSFAALLIQRPGEKSGA